MVSTRRQANRKEQEEWVSESDPCTSEEESDSEGPDLFILECAQYSAETHLANQDARMNALEWELERQRQSCCSKFLGIALPAAVLFFKLAEFALVYAHLQ